MPGNVSAPFKYTIPILRATESNGDLFLEGEASGPEIDVYDSRVHPKVIASFQEQITTRAQLGDPIMYRDTHAQGVLGENPVMSDLGEIVAAIVTDEEHLVVRVRLDKENPAALYLHKQIQRGKKFGMSIGGTVLEYADEYVRDVGRIVRTFTNVVLDHIANTTQPAWTPSLGTVLMRAVEKAIGENMDPVVPAPETPAPAEGVEESVAAEATNDTVAEAAAEEAEETPTVDEAVAEEDTEESTEVHHIEVTALQPIAEAAAALASAVSTLMANQTPAPVAVTRSAEPNDAAPSVESESPVAEDDAITVLRAEFESLRSELAAANDRIRQLEAEPAGNEPGVIHRSEPNVKDELAKLDPHARLLLGLEAAKAATTKQ